MSEPLSSLPPALVSAEAERAVLASVLLDPDWLPAADLVVAHFHSPAHRAIWQSYGALDNTGQPIDLLTLQTMLESSGLLDKVGGVAFLAGLDLDLPDLSRRDHYAAIVRDRYYKRQAHRALIVERDQWGRPAGELLGHLRRTFEGLEGESSAGSELPTLDRLERMAGEIETRAERFQATGKETLGLTTGLPTLDRRLGGLQQGLYLLAGPPGRGKTSLALQIALHVARERPVLYATFENSADNLLLKAVCARAQLSPAEAQRGRLRADRGELERWRQAKQELAPALERFEILEGDGRLTTGKLRARGLAALERHGSPGLVVVDYLQLMAKVSRELRDLTDARGKVETLAGELLALTRKLGSPVLAITAQSRAGYAEGDEGGKARLASLKESGDLEYGADVALFLTAAEAEEQRTAPAGTQALQLTIQKNRHGPTGSVPLYFYGASGGRFLEVAAEEKFLV